MQWAPAAGPREAWHKQCTAHFSTNIAVVCSVVEPEPTGAGYFLLEPEPMKKLRLWVVAVWPRGTVLAK